MMNEDKYKNDAAEPKGFDNVGYTDSADDVKVSVTPVSAVVSTSLPEKTEAPVVIDRRFGYGPCKPSAIQFFNRMWIFVIWLIIFNFLEGFAVNGIASASIPALERQFKLTSSKSSLIPASQDIGAIILILFVSAIGARFNKAAWIAGGSLVMAVGSFVFIIPHIAKKYHYEGEGSGPPPNPCTGSGGGGGPPCESDDQNYLGLFMVAQILHGIGYTPMLTLGPVYLDDNCDHNTAALYVGLAMAGASIGVAAGFFSGGQLLQKYFVDFDRVDQDTLGFDAMDTRWVGAWWLGFVITTVAFVVVSIPIFGYPKYMPGNEKAEEAEKALRSETDTTCGKIVKHTIITFLKAFLRLLKNPVFIFLCLAGCAVLILVFGVSSYAFKYLIEMYSLSFDQAGNYLGGLILIGGAGMFLGGFLIRVFKLELVGMIRLNIGAALLTAILGVSFLAKCPEVGLAGLRVTYPGESVINGYVAGCHSTCSCRDTGFNPVCGDDKVVYYSACHAGCTVPPDKPMGSYSNCSCIAASLNTPVTANATAAFGRCPDDCSSINILLPCLFIMMLSILTVTTPQTMATMRCVDEDMRPFALAVSWILFRLLGTIPGPVLVGTVIDSACELWQGSPCGEDGVCMLYNKENLSMGIMLWWVITSIVVTLFFSIAAIFASRRAKGSFELRK